MRISDFEHRAIQKAVLSIDPDAQIYLFGSRADDSKKGGDIDLVVISGLLKETDRRKIRWSICDQIGEQKIDIVIAQDDSKPFVRIALAEGIKL